jgi:hypothetical protein
LHCGILGSGKLNVNVLTSLSGMLNLQMSSLFFSIEKVKNFPLGALEATKEKIKRKRSKTFDIQVFQITIGQIHEQERGLIN